MSSYVYDHRLDEGANEMYQILKAHGVKYDDTGVDPCDYATRILAMQRLFRKYITKIDRYDNHYHITISGEYEAPSGVLSAFENLRSHCEVVTACLEIQPGSGNAHVHALCKFSRPIHDKKRLTRLVVRDTLPQIQPSGIHITPKGRNYLSGRDYRNVHAYITKEATKPDQAYLLKHHLKDSLLV